MTATRTETSPVAATLIAAVWQIEEWCDANRAAGLASVDACAEVAVHVQTVATACLAGDVDTIVAGVDRLIVTIADPLLELGLDDDSVDGFTCTLRELLHELAW